MPAADSRSGFGAGTVQGGSASARAAESADGVADPRRAARSPAAPATEAEVPYADAPRGLVGLYVHLPWCVSKCPYCDFNSHALRGSVPEDEYLYALFEDLDAELPQLDGREVGSVFIGGGTPSLFRAQAIGELLAGIARRVTLADDAEITLEANPSSADRGRFAGYRAAGVNRLSIGAQSFSAAKLQRLGRAHGPAEIFAAVDAARAGGFADFNLDLMHGLPEQTPDEALADLDAALSLAPTHLSYYQLTLEPNTRFHHDPPPLPDEDTLWRIQQQGEQRLREAGFARYEVSAWARPARQCRHNLNYWRFGDYVGIGAGAHGKLTSRQNITRREKIPNPRAYLHAPGGAARVLRERHLAADDARFEFLLNALRLVDGFSRAELYDALGAWAESMPDRLAGFCESGLLETTPQGWRPTALGFRFLDSVLLEFLPKTPD